MARVDKFENEQVAGFYATCDKGIVGLVAQDGVGAYLVLWGENESEYPALAICFNEVDGAELQVASHVGGPVKTVSLAKLLDLVSPAKSELVK